MSTLVIKKWQVSNNPIDSQGNFIDIVGREGGLISWILAVVKIDPVSSIRVSDKRVEFSTASLSGTTHRMIPVGNVSSTYYGYHKPWKSGLVIFLVLLFVLSLILGDGFLAKLVVTLFSLGIALGYYFLSRTLTLGFVEYSGAVSSIQFKRSVIENVDVDEGQAKFVSEVTQFLIESARKSMT
jgi:hypothetical protein